MQVLGVTADDKGAQLESLVQTMLQGQGYRNVRTNLVGAGGNELDVVASLETPFANSVQVIPVVGEAKAYAGPLNMPMWQRFLGKVFIERAAAPSTIGVLIALNGVNGNVHGSFRSLQSSNLVVIDGDDLAAFAEQTGEIASLGSVRQTVIQQYQMEPSDLTVAYYGGAFRWIVRWSSESYSIVDGRGQLLSAEIVEGLRSALASEVSGELLATAEALAQAERVHDTRIAVLGRLLRGLPVTVGNSEERDLIDDLAARTFCRFEHGVLTLVPASELNADGVAQLFRSLFENRVSVHRLDFMIDGHHEPYVRRLIEVLPDLQMGFDLDESSRAKLMAISPLFPSVWITLASPIQMITVHRSDEMDHLDDAIEASDYTAFWEAVADAIRSDFGNPNLRGFLYDHLNVAEIEEETTITYKSKSSVLGEVTITTRDSIGKLGDDLIGEANTRHMLIRTLHTAPQPWEHEHPEPDPISEGQEWA